MKKTLLLAGLVVATIFTVGTAQAEPATDLAAMTLAAPAADASAPPALASLLSTECAVTVSATGQAEQVVCCTAADRADCKAECAPQSWRTFCIGGICECQCF